MKLGIVITVKGRRQHLEQTLPLLPPEMVILVDQQCPQESGKWAEGLGVTVAYDLFGPTFNKPRANNIGAIKASRMGKDYLLFLDADTIAKPGLLAWVTSYANEESFQVCLSENRDLTGVLGISTLNFLKSGGFDENIQGYGCEDQDMRLRLHFQQKLAIRPIPEQMMSAIPHSDELRAAHHQEKDLMKNAQRNLEYIEGKAAKYLGFPLGQLYLTEHRDTLILLTGASPDV